MTGDERQAILDYFSCAAMEAAEALQAALDELRAELLGGD